MEFPKPEPEEPEVSQSTQPEPEHSGATIICWSCQNVIPAAEAVQLRQQFPVLRVPACIDCWASMDAASRLKAAQEAWDAEKLRLHREGLVKIASEVLARLAEAVGLDRDVE